MRITGLLPPLPTPFRSDGTLALDLLGAFVERLNAAPLQGFVVLGSNGEAPHVTEVEAVVVIRVVRQTAAPGRLVVAGTGRASTAATIEATRRAAGEGCDGVLVVPPSYYRAAATAEALREHYEAVADSSPVPVLLYNVPANTNVNLPPEVVAALSRHPNVAGIKDSAGDVGQLAEFVRVTRGRKPFDVVSGNFGATLPGHTVGVAGAILAVANVAPGECAAILDHFRAGRLDEARELHLRLLPVARAVTVRYGVPGLKAALEALGVAAGVCRLPLLPLGDAERSEIAALLRDADLLKT